MTDYIIRPWRPEDRPALRALWQTAFGDGADYIDGFFARFPAPGGCVTADVGGKAVSAMYILGDVTVHTGRHTALTAGYTYALATLPEYRGRGIGGAVYRAAVSAALEKADAACVLPAEAGLYPFYESAGAAPVSYVREARLSRGEMTAAAPVRAYRADPWQYANMREALLRGLPHAEFPEAFYDQMEAGGTEFFLLENGGGAAMDAPEDGVCRVTEFLDPGGDGCEKSLAALAGWRDAEAYIVRSPVFSDGPGEIRPFALAVWKDAPSAPLPDDLWWGFGLE